MNTIRRFMFFLRPDGFIRSDRYRRCWHCGLPTRSVEINFEAPLHRGWCSFRKEAEFWRAVSS